MTERRSARTLLLMTTGIIIAAVTLAAQAQTVTSPFAKKKKKQAWETYQTDPSPSQSETSSQQSAPTPTTYTSPSATTYSSPSTYSPSSTYTPQSPASSQPSHLPRTYSGPAAGSYSSSPPSYAAPSATYTAPSSSTGSSYTAPSYNAPAQTPSSYPAYEYQTAPAASQDYETETLRGYQSRPAARAAAPQYEDGAYYPGRAQTPQSYGGPVQSAPQSLPPAAAPRKQSLADRLGLNNVLTTLSGFLKLGAAGTRRNGKWGEDFIVDGAARGELSMVTQGGIEYGAGLALRGQYDKYRRGFGGRVGDCPPTLAGCGSAVIAGMPTAIRGHTTQFYTSGPSNAKKGEFQLEGAYVFLRTAYGDITAGRDDGAAYLFSLGAPTLLAVGGSNNSVDYTGLDAVKTVNDASGFAEKITYTTPRLLGDTVGVGIQVGASYTPKTRVCGTDYCVRTNGKDGSGAVAPVLEDVMEAGLSLDRNFGNGLKVEATATYAQASEKSNITAFDDLKAWGGGLEISYDNFTLGGSYLDSNNGLANGDYTAWDVGATWQPGALGFTLGYGHGEDKNAGLKSDQGVFGITYDWNEHYRIGTGVQYIQRDAPFNVGGVLTPTKEKATALFVEGKITF